MAINLLTIQPHKVSRDLSGYITYIYGEAKVGKTTLCSKFPGALILAFERGYNALPGVYVQDITRWSEFKEVLRELKKPEVQDTYKSIIIDTIDIAGAMCEKYICNQLGIDNIGDGGWTNNGWSRYKKELEDSFRTITQLGYALIFISHDKDKTFKRQDGSEYNQIVPTAQTSLNNIAKDMADLYAYARIKNNAGDRTLVFRSLDNSIDCGCRFKYIESEIPLDYDALINALNEAIDKEAQEHNNRFVTEERATIVTAPEYDYDALMNEFQETVGKLMNENSALYGPRIVQIVDKYLGKGKKVSDTTREQAEFIYLIVKEIKEDLLN